MAFLVPTNQRKILLIIFAVVATIPRVKSDTTSGTSENSGKFVKFVMFKQRAKFIEEIERMVKVYVSYNFMSNNFR